MSLITEGPLLVLNTVCSTYGVKLIQKLHEVFLKLKDDLFTLKEEKKKRKISSARGKNQLIWDTNRE